MSQIEQHVYRYSKAPIWELQRAYYEEQGIGAWQGDEVPSYITSNPLLAASYAEMIFGFLQDRARLGDTSETVTILELGAGSGRLAFHIMKELSELTAYAGIPIPPYRYVMSDLATGNVAFWQQHPGLIPFVEQGVLDFAVFDAVEDTELILTQSGIRIREGDLQQPLFIVANYFFDSIPQELIYVEDNQIYECLVAMELPEHAAQLSASDKLKQIACEYQYRKSAEYEQQSYRYRVLMELYAAKLEDSHVLFPEAGLRCLERLGQFSQEGFLLLTADKGDHRLESWEYNEPPELIHHGSFSLTANYHAISTYFEHNGALSLFTQHAYHHLNVGCILMLAEPLSYGHSRLAYRRFIEQFGPDDFITVKEWLDPYAPVLNIPEMLAFWRLSGYDTQFFLQNSKRLAELLISGEEADFGGIAQGIALMWRGYYPLDITHHLALESASLLYGMEMFQEALPYYLLTLKTYEDVSILYEMAICYYELNEAEKSKEFAQRTLAYDSIHEGALALLNL
ncbi:hypothetical protein BC351_03420 [Paenibacillus ferrarius]|uniref:Tetratricopeptide repeat protein n=1 Tax=Paenibacillus ferrarius TaxID=1469647 RepID=A0A1V4HL37_9BACL|nr:hypothetical protein [Paenibacillus ferrarius]OPH57586.1 hypothetical protein BC351_03420 [Paenibacillus ferrarius]